MVLEVEHESCHSMYGERVKREAVSMIRLRSGDSLELDGYV